MDYFPLHNNIPYLVQTLIFIFFLTTTTSLLYTYTLIFLRPKTHGFRVYPFFGTLPDFLINRHRFLDWTTSILSTSPSHTAVFHRPGKVHGVITANPNVIQHMLKTNFHNYPKGPRFISLLSDFLGTGIFNADGESWKMQRKTASYEFSTKSLRNFVMQNVAFELNQRLIPLLDVSMKNDVVLDLQDVLERFAFDNICKVAFNYDPGCLSGDGSVGKEFMQAFEEAANLSSGRFMYAVPNLYRVKKFFDVGSEKKLREAIETVHRFADEVIRTRIDEETAKKDEDLLSRFIGNGTSDNSDNSAEFLRDIVISFILAGRDTTSSALSWFFWLLALNPDVERKILEELEKIRGDNGKGIGESYDFDELREMHYLQASIMESMRLYPPVPVDTKACTEDDVLPDGTFIGKDWFMTYHTYAMGRIESVWGKDCCEYKPERWIDEETGMCKLNESPFKYPVFHGGVRMCLGKDMAYIQMKSIAASVLERFRFDLVMDKGKCPEYLLSLTLRMKGGLHVRVKAREVVSDS